MLKKVVILLIVLFLAGCSEKELNSKNNVENFSDIVEHKNIDDVVTSGDTSKTNSSDLSEPLENESSTEIKDNQQEENYNVHTSEEIIEKPSKTEQKDNSVNNNQNLTGENKKESTDKENQEKEEHDNIVEEIAPEKELTTPNEEPKIENNEEYLNWKKIYRYSTHQECMKASDEVANELFNKGIIFRNLTCDWGKYRDETGYKINISFDDGTYKDYTTE